MGVLGEVARGEEVLAGLQDAGEGEQVGDVQTQPLGHLLLAEVGGGDEEVHRLPCLGRSGGGAGLGGHRVPDSLRRSAFLLARERFLR
jgi:hypothetical protein